MHSGPSSTGKNLFSEKAYMRPAYACTTRPSHWLWGQTLAVLPAGDLGEHGREIILQQPSCLAGPTGAMAWYVPFGMIGTVARCISALRQVPLL